MVDVKLMGIHAAEAEIRDLRAENARLRRQRDTAREALAFYAAPWGKCDQVPDFYSEMDFGDHARRTLAALDGEDQT